MTIRLPTTTTPPIRHVDGVAVAPPSTARGRSLRVLLVEDHPDTAEQLTRLLTRAGHKVSCAATVKEALERGRLGGFDILISDLGLPDGSGYDLVRDFAQPRHIPAIALSGFGMKQDVENSIAAGFSRHFTKPVDWYELQSEILKVAEAKD